MVLRAVSRLPGRLAGAPHAKQRPLGAEPVVPQPVREPAVPVECIHHDRPAVRRKERCAHERPRGATRSGATTGPIRSEAPRTSEAVPWAPASVSITVRVLRGAGERPLEDDAAVGAEDPIVQRGHARQIGRRETTHMHATRGRASRPARAARRLGDMTRQHRLVFEAVSLVERFGPAAWRPAGSASREARRRWPLPAAARRCPGRASPDRRASSQSSRTRRSRCRSRCR